MFCGKCGASIPEGYDFCMHCGTKVDTSNIDSIESNIADNKIKKKNVNKKVLIPVGTAIVVLLAVVAIFFGMKTPSEKSGYFANIPWGTDIEKVKEKVDEVYKNCNSSIDYGKNEVIAIIKNYEGVQGVTAAVTLSCKDKGVLNRAQILFSCDGDKSNYSEITNMIIEKYSNLFGEATHEKDYLYKWIAEKGTIELTLNALGATFFFLTFEEKN